MYERQFAARALQKVKRLSDLRREFERLARQCDEYWLDDLIHHPDIYDAAMTARFSTRPVLLECWQIIRQRLADGLPPFPDDSLPAPLNYWKPFIDTLLQFADTRTPPDMLQAASRAGSAFLNAGGSSAVYQRGSRV